MVVLKDNPSRYKIIYGGRGSAKSWSVARILLDFGYRAKLRILCAREIQNTIEESVHQLLQDQIGNLGLDWFYKVTNWSITGLNGTTFVFRGIRKQDVTKVKSYEAFDIVWVEEAQVVRKESWKILLPTIRAEEESLFRPGEIIFSEIWITFNPDLDTDETYTRFIVHPPEDAILVKLNYRDNPWFPKVLENERLEMLRQVEAGNEEQSEYDNIWEGKCKPAVEGAIYAHQVERATEEGRIACNVPYDPLLKVHTVWDLGWGVMAIGFYQRQASEMRVIDYEEYNERTYSEVVEEIETKSYRWGTDFLPHDSKSHNPLSKKTPKQMLTALGRKVEEVPDIGVESGIKAGQQLFSRCYFDKDNAGLLVERLKRYKRRINQATDAATTPMPDENAHGADQFRYAAIVADQMTNEAPHIPDPYKGFSGKRGWAG